MRQEHVFNQLPEQQPQNSIYALHMKISFLFSLHAELIQSFSSALQESVPRPMHSWCCGHVLGSYLSIDGIRKLSKPLKLSLKQSVVNIQKTITQKYNIYFDYHYFLVAQILISQCTSDGHYNMLHMPCYFVSFFSFKHGGLKCHKKRAKFICEQLAKVLTVY